MEIVNKGKIPRVGSIDFLIDVSTTGGRYQVTKHTLSVAIFIHSSKLEFITSNGSLTNGGATVLSCCFCLLLREVSPWSLGSLEGPATGASTPGILVLFLLLLFSAASSLMLTDLRGTRPESEVKLSFSGTNASLRRLRTPLFPGLE